MNYRLSLGTKDLTVYFFRQLVNRAMYESSSAESGNNSNQSIGSVKPIEFDRQLYDDALSLLESKSVGLKRTDDTTLYKYGKFSGGNTYKDYNGTLSSSTANSSEGWVEIVPSTSEYFLYKSRNTYLIIACKDFSPEPVIEDFMPLYEALKSKEPYVKPSETAGAVNATFSEISSEKLQQVEEDETTKDDDKEEWEKVVYDKENNELYNKTVNIRAERRDTKLNSYVWNDIQAVVYDMKDEMGTMTDAPNVLYCFQQPESISYTAQAQYDPSTTRGSQQPFQFYSNANAIELSFVLKWHNDEVKTLSVDGKSLSLQEIADIAEDFTRPWTLDNSLKPKLVKVVLPGISEIGYMTQAQITYNGDMTGDFTTGSGVMNDSTQWNSGRGASGNQHQFTTNYYYNQLEITFSLIVVKDTKLLPADSSAHKEIDVVYSSGYSAESETPQNTGVDESDKASQQTEPATSSSDIRKSVWLLATSSISSGGPIASATDGSIIYAETIS